MRLPARAATSAWAVARGVAWIHRRRALHRPLAQPLDGEALDGLARYFPPDLLEAIRVRKAQGPRLAHGQVALRPRGLEAGSQSEDENESSHASEA